MITFLVLTAAVIILLVLSAGLIFMVLGRREITQIDNRVRDKELRVSPNCVDYKRVFVLGDGREVEVDPKTYHSTDVGDVFTGEVITGEIL